MKRRSAYGRSPANAGLPAQAQTVPLRAWSVLAASTLAFMVCFVVWMMFGVLGVQLRADLGLNSTEFGLLTSTPVLTGALMRLPLGTWTDRFGGRIVMTVLLVVCARCPCMWSAMRRSSGSFS
jgi:NNP family nitrate/nitrite transporter-like MFS transporter